MHHWKHFRWAVFVHPSFSNVVSALMKRWPSFANLNSSTLFSENISETKMINIKGERTAPCGTPMLVLTVYHLWSPVSLFELLFFKTSVASQTDCLNAVSDTPSQYSIHPESKVFSRSKDIKVPNRFPAVKILHLLIIRYKVVRCFCGFKIVLRPQPKVPLVLRRLRLLVLEPFPIVLLFFFDDIKTFRCLV